MPKSNRRPDYTRYVHEFTNTRGQTRFGVGAWDPQHGQYWAPVSSEIRRLTGCSIQFSQRPGGLDNYSDRQRALRRARYLFDVYEHARLCCTQ